MIIQKQYEYVCRVKKTYSRQNSFERIVNSKFQYPKANNPQSEQGNKLDTINFKSQMYFNEADKLSQQYPIWQPKTNPLNNMYLLESQRNKEDMNGSFIKQAVDLGSVDDLNNTYVSLDPGQIVLLEGDDKTQHNQSTYQNTFLSSKWNRDRNYESPIKYPQKALLTQSGFHENNAIQIVNPNTTRKYLTNLKTHLIHKMQNLSKEPELKTRFEHIDNQLQKQREAKYNPGFKEPFKAEFPLRKDTPEKHVGPQFELRFVKNEICDQSKISKIDDQTREQLQEEMFMKDELDKYLKDQQYNSNRKQFNLKYKLDPITNPLRSNDLRRKNKYRNPTLDQTSFLINEVYYDKEFEAKSNPLLCQDKQKLLGETFSHRFSNSSIVQYRKGRSMSRTYPYNRGIFDISQNTTPKSLNQSFI